MTEISSLEKMVVKPFLYGILEQSSLIDFPGHLTSVFFTSGCNFACPFCHNPDLIKRQPGNLTWDEVDRFLAQSQAEWVDAICITGGEPTLHDGLYDLVQHIKQRGFYVKLDTNGSNPDRIEEVQDLVDYIAMDYKAPRDSYHQMSGSHVDLDDIDKSIHLLKKRDVSQYEIRTTVVEGLHSLNDMEQIGVELEGVKHYVIQPFIPQENLCDSALTSFERTSVVFMKEALDRVKIHVPNVVMRGVGL